MYTTFINANSQSCKVVRPGRSFLSRLIARANSVSHLHYNIRVNAEMRRDCRIWLKFLDEWNGRALFLSDLNADEEVFLTDAAGGWGYGGFFDGRWFSCRWSSNQLGWDIVAMELYPILISVDLWGHLWKGKCLVVRCDNLPTVAAVNKAYSKIPVISDMLRVIMFLSLRHNFHMKAVHVSGKFNIISDSLSRLQVERFRQLAPAANPEPCTITRDPLKLCEELFVR